MDFLQLIADLRKREASDLHLEPGLSPVARINGLLKPVGNRVLEPRETSALARSLFGEREKEIFTTLHAVDFSQVMGGGLCRINVMKTQRGVGLAIRLLASVQPTLTRLNLHPTFTDLVSTKHGLLVICGSTGCGKSSTLAALIHEINTREKVHIVTIESPIEYAIAPRQSLIRQREVGRDTPTFERALIDALRQDPDVIMVGEMRDREIMQLTLNAAETGHLVLSTMHASTTAEALQRLAAAFPPENQSAVCAQLADCLIGVVAQRLRFDEELGIRVPICEILRATTPIKHLIRQGHFFKMASAMETGYAEGNWTFRRYQEWLDSRTDYYRPSGKEEINKLPDLDQDLEMPDLGELPSEEEIGLVKNPPPVKKAATFGEASTDDVIVIEEPDEKSLTELLKKLNPPPKKSDGGGA
ncbi:MAG: PilT/PilU family type 4a pilus ATPase [Planctomycetes bacterium]|nr:PilT/PilU family type 4a pilus ATPase [Planctomycetota bacterium]